MTYQKIDSSTIQKTESVAITYNVAKLKVDLENLKANKIMLTADTDRQIAEIEKLLVEADKLGIK